jgi:CubicO group peptidase (beta-lactamase class C family)
MVTHHGRLFLCVLAWGFLLTLSSCTAGSTLPVPATMNTPSMDSESGWPTREWPVSEPQAQGMDAGMLAKLLAEIERRDMAIHSLLIIRNGAIVSETYYGNQRPDARHDQYSVTKSFVSTLVGIAIDHGLIQNLDQSVQELLPRYPVGEPADLYQRITLEHVLTMTSGLGWSETDAGFGALYQSDDWPGFILALPITQSPGTEFSYCSGCSHLLTAIVENVAEKGVLDFAHQNLFEPLGITDWSWERDADGVPIGGWGLRLTPRDMAKMGYLFLHQGEWDGQQIVSANWVAAATKQHTTTDDVRGYGYQWWIDPDGKAFAALGRDGQMIYVRPETDLIVVTTAGGVAHDEIFQLIESYVLPAAGRYNTR